jgi:protein-tyrosine phosphatase
MWCSNYTNFPLNRTLTSTMLSRLLHAIRRRRARRALARKRVRSVLFLCDGNLYRSPYAAAVLRRALADTHLSNAKIESSGFFSPGRSAPEAALSAARAKGIDLSSHISTLLNARSLATADVVVVMSEDQARSVRPKCGRQTSVVVLGDLDTVAGETRDIIDPLGRSGTVLEQVYARIERCVQQLATIISPRSRSATKRH